MGIAVIFRKFVVLFWAFLLATAAIAGDECRTKIEIAIDDDDNGVTIISGKSVDEATRERIREALQSAGQDGEVAFIDSNEPMTGDGAHERHEVRIIRKEVDVTN